MALKVSDQQKCDIHMLVEIGKGLAHFTGVVLYMTKLAE
jgi:hypothetical protein